MTLHFSGDSSNAQLFSAACVISSDDYTAEPWMNWVQQDLDIQHARIMIVDDEPVVLQVLRRHLQDFGCENIVICSESTKALDLIRELKPDLLMLDLLMPHISGLEILQAIRNDAEFKLLPVLVMTASTDPETKILALLSGATDYLQKPLEMTDVLPRVRNALVVKKHQDEVKQYMQCLQQQAADLEHQVEVRTAEQNYSGGRRLRCA